MPNPFTYIGKNKKEISFPLGGIGTGCIGLAGNGALIDWQIFGRPNRGGKNGFTHFAVKAEREGNLIDARVLNGDLDTECIDNGDGLDRLTMAGMPHFKENSFQGEYPFATLEFSYPKFPGIVRETAWNPFIPTNEDDSSIPCAVFAFEIENTTNRRLDYTIACAAGNPASPNAAVNRFESKPGMNLLYLTGDDLTQKDKGYVDFTVATDHPDISFQEYYYRGTWFDQLLVYWDDFTKTPRFQNRTYSSHKQSRDPDGGVLAAHVSIEPGQSKAIRFVLSWNVPNMFDYWTGEPVSGPLESRPSWKHYYATQFEDSRKSSAYLLSQYGRLLRETKAFHDALFASSLPLPMLEAVSANLATLKSPTCLRLQDGSFYAFEGCSRLDGWCEGSCTHVWNYAYTLAFLFPRLERSMRELDFAYNYHDSGLMSFRLMLPLGSHDYSFRACVDGQMGGIFKVYRDYKIGGDLNWLKKLWPRVKKSLEYAWSSENTDSWDRNHDGVLEGRQHHTLDMELFGPSAWLEGFYLLGLEAGVELAGLVGDFEAADQYQTLLEQGKRFLNTQLWNGEYFIQKIGLTDRSLLSEYAKASGIYGTPHEKDGNGETADDVYWSEEHGEIKYQIGEGCLSDQLLGQWHANLAGLGRIFDPKKTKKALKSIYQYNYQKEGFRDFANPCRLYAINGEKGLMVCNWPDGKKRPKVPIPYSQEVFNGIEYALASLMIQEGELRKAKTIVKAARGRYKGANRNPFGEIECGSYYARNLSSYALLLAASGFSYDYPNQYMGFDPVDWKDGRETSYFWSLEGAWGTVNWKDNQATLSVIYGTLPLRAVSVGKEQVKQVHWKGKKLSFQQEGITVTLNQLIQLNAGDMMTLRW